MPEQSLFVPDVFDPFISHSHRLFLMRPPTFMMKPPLDKLAKGFIMSLGIKFDEPTPNMSIFRKPGPVPYNVYSMEYKKMYMDWLQHGPRLRINCYELD